MPKTIKELQQQFYVTQELNGWVERPTDVSKKLLLIHSEVSEACEADREPGPDAHLPQYPNLAVELADIVIRTLGFAEQLGYDLGPIIEAKDAYNRTAARRVHNKGRQY
jgi:hypothetical protein